MLIGIENAEKLIFEDRALWKHMSDLAHYREQWSFSKISPHLKPTGTRAIIGFLQDLDDSHIRIISNYFGLEVTIDKFNPGSVRNVEFKIEDEPDLEDMSFYTGFSTTREDNTIKITFWR